MKKLVALVITLIAIFATASIVSADTVEFNAQTADEMKMQLDAVYRIDMYELDDYNVKMIYASIRAMYSREPELTEYGLQHLKEVSWIDEEIDHRYAQTYRTGGIIELSHYYYDNNCLVLKYRYAQSVVSNYHPSFTNYNAVFMHEFGHVIDGAFMVEYARQGYTTDAVVIRAYQNTITDHSLYGWRTSICTYAGMSYAETIAEGWCDYIQNGDRCEEASLAIVEELKATYADYKDYDFEEPESESANWYDTVYACDDDIAADQTMVVDLIDTYNVDISTLEPKDQKYVQDAINRMYEAEPELTVMALEKLNKVTYMSVSRINSYPNSIAYTTFKTSVIELNPKYFTDSRTLQQTYTSTVFNGIHPLHTSADGVLIHELGHIIMNCCRDQYRVADNIVFTAYKESNTDLSYKDWVSDISYYASTDTEEAFCEAVCDYVYNKDKAYCPEATKYIISEFKDYMEVSND